MKNAEVARQFERAADVLALLDENGFRVIALRKVARAVEEMPEAVETAAEKGTLENVPGVGKSSVDRIKEFLKTGKIAEFEDLASQVPAGVLEVLRIPSVGPKTAALLWRDGGVSAVADLKQKIEAGAEKNWGGLAGIKGLGEKKLLKILENLTHLSAATGRIRLGEAWAIGEEFVAFLHGIKGVKQAVCCGSLRRGKETIGDIDIAVCASLSDGLAIAEAVAKHPLVAQVIQKGESKTSVRTAGGGSGGGAGLQIDVRVIPEESFGAALQYFTGSKEHNVKLREMAVKKGLKINEWGVYRVAGGKEEKIAGETEEGIYAAMGLPWIPPEMREDKGEIERSVEGNSKLKMQNAKPASEKAAARKSETKNQKLKIENAGDVFELVELSHIRGDLHMHTTASDGSCSIEEMAAEAKRRGYEYIAITDHSKSQFQANGLKADRLLSHIESIHAVAKEAIKSGLLILAGSEVDILADGSLDYEDDLLAKLDWVVASPHAALSQESDAATQRLVRAAANPYVCVIGHPTGRLIPSRRGLEPDMGKVIFAAARSGVAMEINASPWRLDLRDSHARLAVEAKVPLCIDTDAHGLADFEQMRFGILTARRGWAKAADVLNTWPVEKFKKWLKDRKSSAEW